MPSDSQDKRGRGLLDSPDSKRDSKLKGAYQIDGSGRLLAPGIDRPDGLVPVSVQLPSLNDLLDLTPNELIDILQRYGIVENWAAIKNRAQYTTSQLHDVSGPMFQRKLENAIQAAQTQLVGECRRTLERYTTVMAVDGKPEQLLIRMPEDYDPGRICDACYELAGTIGSLSQHEAVGLPGSSSCLGGNLCRCTLVPYEE